MFQWKPEKRDLVALGQVFHRAVTDSERFVGEEYLFDTLRERRQDKAGDLLRLLVVTNGAGASGNAPDVAARHRVDNNAELHGCS